MSAISKALKKLIENPDDLTALPSLIAQVEELEDSEENYQLRIGKLQDLNKKYLAQIPIPGNEPEEEPNEQPTLDDAKNYLIKKLGGNE